MRVKRACILGLDPGVARTGYALLDVRGSRIRAVAYGCITTHQRVAYGKRLLELRESIEQLLLRHQPTFAALEKLFFSKNVTTAFAVGQARGVLLLTLASHRIPTIEFTPQAVKQAAAGYGRADKLQVQRMVQRLLNLKELPRPDDAADALAVALTAAAHRTPPNDHEA